MLTLHSPAPLAWRAFAGGRRDVDAGADVLRSWMRARANGARFEGLPVGDAFVGDRDLDTRRDAMDELLAASHAALGPLVSTLQNAGYVGVLTDRDGVILDQMGGGAFLAQAARAQLVPGAHWGESIRGTNAIGTALAESTAVACEGLAHLHTANHGLICYASPVHAPDGSIAGVIDLTGDVDAASAFARGLAPTLASRIEEAWRQSRYDRSIPGGLRGLLAAIDDARDPAAFIDGGGRVRHANAAMRGLAPRAESVEALCGHTWTDLRRMRSGRFASTRLSPLRGRRLLARRIEDTEGRCVAVVLYAERATPDAPGIEARPSTPPRPRSPFDALDGDDPGLAATVHRAERFARTDLPVLLLAETGTGKDVLARAVHEASPRAQAPFVAVNCGAFTPSLLQSELFGYGPGAFTGALRDGRPGFIEVADGGTLFLDEVADLSLPAQAALLRVLDDGTFHRVGDTAPRRADARLVSATCRDLDARVADGRFRVDLYYRLRGARLTLPALRDRTDLAALIARAVRRAADEQGHTGVRLSPDAHALAMAWTWPGNFRELGQTMRAAVALSNGGLVRPEHLPSELRVRTATAPPPRDSLDAVLEQVGGNVSEAARILGVARSTVYRRLARRGSNGDED